jgi:hypothetical protein
MITIRIVTERLSDGSEAYNVQFGDMLLHAITESDACELADKLARALYKHTVDGVTL